MTVEGTPTPTPTPTPERLDTSPFDEDRNNDEDLIVEGEDYDDARGGDVGLPPDEEDAAAAAAFSSSPAVSAVAVVGRQETGSIEEGPAVVSSINGTNNDNSDNNNVDVVVGSEKNDDEGGFTTSSSGGGGDSGIEEEEDTDNYDSSSNSNVNGHGSGTIGKNGNNGGDNKSKATDCLMDVQAIIAGDCTDEEGEERNDMKKKKKKKNKNQDPSLPSTANMMLEDVVTATDAVVAVAVAAAAAAAASSNSEGPAPAPTPIVTGEGENENESEKADPVAGGATPPVPPVTTKNNDTNVQDKLCGTTIDGSSLAAANTLDCCDNFCAKKNDVVLEEEKEQVIVGIFPNNENTNEDPSSKYLVSNMMMPLPGSDRQHVEQFKDEEELGGGGGSMASGNTYYYNSRDVIIPYGIERNNTNASSFIRSISSSFSSNKNNVNGGGVTMISRFRNMFTGGLNHQNNDVNKKESGGVNSSNPNEDTFIGDDGIILDGIDRSQMYNNSILDMESVVCDDDDDDKDGDGDDFAVGRCKVKRDPHQMRWIVLMCCIIHLVLVSLIIGFAVISRQEESSSPSAGSVENNSNSNDGGSSVIEIVAETAVPSIEATTPEKDGMMDNPDSPTVVENIEPTCADALEVSASCFSTNTGGDILVFFRSCTPEPGDWLGVYEASGQPTTMSVRVSDVDAVDWLFTCGDRECQDPIEQEVVPFQQVNGQYEAGTLYQVHMFRDGDGPMYSSFASSPPFQIVDGAVDCTV